MRRPIPLLCTLALLAAGCGESGESAPASAIETEVTGEATPWSGLGEIESPGDFRFAVVSDRTGEHRTGVFASAMPKLNLVEPDFVVSVGDLIEGYTEDLETLGHEWDEFEGFVGGLRMPFFYVAGNHDMSNEVMALEWQRRFGPSYYSFVYEDVLFLVLNSELFGMVHDPDLRLPGPWNQAEQLAFAERVLAENADARWTFVLVHQPLWDGPDGAPADWEKVEALLGERPYTVFAGHYHQYTTHVRNDRQYITLATTGGGSGLRGLPFGEFDHVAYVTMTGDEPVIANLMLDGIQGSRVRTEALRDRVRKLEGAVTPEAALGAGALFRDGIARFRISNDDSAPLRIAGRFERGRDIEPLVRELERTVPAGAVARVEVPYHAPGAPVAYEGIAPARVVWTLRGGGEDDPVEIELESVVHPERRFEIEPATNPVRVDGDLSEWGSLRFSAERPGELSGHGPHAGPRDASFRFGVAYDDENLYFAVDVTDDSLVAGSDLIGREQDHVQVQVDARPDPERSANEGFYEAMASGSFSKLLGRTVTLEEPREDPLLELFGTGGPPEGSRQASARTERGYAVEVSIPTSALNEARGADWDALRINLAVTDFDAGEPDHTVLYWRASRFGPRAPEGSGTFERR